ncbi:hypothetical protein ACIBVL_00575 [Streptomyces sp. NPDC049687]
MDRAGTIPSKRPGVRHPTSAADGGIEPVAPTLGAIEPVRDVS